MTEDERVDGRSNDGVGNLVLDHQLDKFHRIGSGLEGCDDHLALRSNELHHLSKRQIESKVSRLEDDFLAIGDVVLLVDTIDVVDEVGVLEERALWRTSGSRSVDNTCCRLRLGHILGVVGATSTHIGELEDVAIGDAEAALC